MKHLLLLISFTFMLPIYATTPEKIFTSEDYTDLGSPTNLVIPKGFTSIGEQALSQCESLTTISIPNTVTSIDAGAFWECISLTEIVIPNSVTSIGASAFGYCESLTKVSIPNSVTSIDAAAFWGCMLLNEIVLPNSVTSIGERAFSKCNSLSAITIPNSVTSIGEGIFWGCHNLNPINISLGENFIIENGILYDKGKTIILSTFKAYLPESVIIPNTVTSIGKWAFLCCESLTHVSIPNSVTSIGTDAFYACDNLNPANISMGENFIIENGILYDKGKTIILSTFEDYLPDSVIIPNTVTFIGDCAFLGCKSLTHISIPNSVISIGTDAFSRCSSLTKITIPNSVTSIGEGAFYGCYNLNPEGISLGENFIIENGILYDKGKTIILSAFKEQLPDSVIIPNTVTFISSKAFSDCESLTKISIPNSVTSIGYLAFLNCESLTTISISEKSPISWELKKEYRGKVKVQ